MGKIITIGGSAGGGGGDVSSVFSRTGIITAQSGDYKASQVTNDSLIPGATTALALNELGVSTSDNASDINTLQTNNTGVNTGDETTLTIQTKRPLKTVNSQSLEGVGNVVITVPALTKISSYSSAVINNFNSNALTNVPNMQLTIASNGNYSFVSTINCNNDNDEEVEVTLAITPISSRNITLIDGTVQALTAGVQFSFVKQLQFDTQKKKQDQTLQRDFILNGLIVGDLIDVQLNTRGDNVDIDNRWLTGFSVS